LDIVLFSKDFADYLVGDLEVGFGCRWGGKTYKSPASFHLSLHTEAGADPHAGAPHTVEVDQVCARKWSLNGRKTSTPSKRRIKKSAKRRRIWNDTEMLQLIMRDHWHIYSKSL